MQNHCSFVLSRSESTVRDKFKVKEVSMAKGLHIILSHNLVILGFLLKLLPSKLVSFISYDLCTLWSIISKRERKNNLLLSRTGCRSLTSLYSFLPSYMHVLFTYVDCCEKKNDRREVNTMSQSLGSFSEVKQKFSTICNSSMSTLEVIEIFHLQSFQFWKQKYWSVTCSLLILRTGNNWSQ